MAAAAARAQADAEDAAAASQSAVEELLAQLEARESALAELRQQLEAAQREAASAAAAAAAAQQQLQERGSTAGSEYTTPLARSASEMAAAEAELQAQHAAEVEQLQVGGNWVGSVAMWACHGMLPWVRGAGQGRYRCCQQRAVWAADAAVWAEALHCNPMGGQQLSACTTAGGAGGGAAGVRAVAGRSCRGCFCA